MLGLGSSTPQSAKRFGSVSGAGVVMAQARTLDGPAHPGDEGDAGSHGSTACSPASSVAVGGKGKGSSEEFDGEAAGFVRIGAVADGEGIVWTKIKGHPYWPSQIVSVTAKIATEPRFKAAARFKRKTDDVCVQYFGTQEIAWVEEKKATLPWSEGIEKKLHTFMRNRAVFVDALNEVKGYCARQTKYPRGWWCEPDCLVRSGDFIAFSAKDARPPVADFNPKKLWANAEKEGVVWAKVRGFPDWPVQVIPFERARVLYPELKLPPAGAPPTAAPGASLNGAGVALPCMFFGTGEVMVVPERCMIPMGAGVEKGFVSGSDGYDFRIALGEVYGYLQIPRVWPSEYADGRAWWNLPDAKDEPEVRATIVEAPPPPLPKYEFLRRSVWPDGDSCPGRSRGSDISVCVCVPKPSGTCKDVSCLNYMSRTTCDPVTCPAGESCRNPPFHRRRKHDLRPFFTNDGRGWGLRTFDYIRKGEFVCEYVGEIIDKAECERRLKAIERRVGASEYYMMEISSDHVLDAAAKGNLSRFINSSCEPTCATQKWIDAATDQTRVGIFALTDISPGTELLYNYCFQDFGLASKKGKRSFTCRCGSPSCCMYEEGEYERTERLVGRRIKSRWDDGWYTGTVIKYDPATKGYTVLYDDGESETLGLGENPTLGGDVHYKLLPVATPS